MVLVYFIFIFKGTQRSKSSFAKNILMYILVFKSVQSSTIIKSKR